MASNQTSNYGLSQWEATDAVQRLEFNADNAKVDAALKSLSNQMVQKANQSALNTVISAVNQKADAATVSSLSSQLSTEISQRQTADNALQTALALKGNCQVYTTTYTGTGTVSRTFSFPKLPLLVIIGGPAIYLVAVRGITALLSTENGESNNLTGTWSGTALTVAYNGNWGGGDRRACNASGSSYRIVALLDMGE